MFERILRLKENETCIRTEVIAGVTTLSRRAVRHPLSLSRMSARELKE